MIKGVGTDIIEIDRIELAIKRNGQKFLNKLFTPKEIAYCSKFKEFARHYAARFAAKEATAKAFGVGIGDQLQWLDIEIYHSSLGQPQIRIENALYQQLECPKLLLSMSHCKKYATAVVILEK